MNCHLYENNSCIAKKFCSNDKIKNHNCENNTELCSFKIKPSYIIFNDVKIKIKQIANPYSVVSDLLIIPTNPELNLDDPLFLKMGGKNLEKEYSKYKDTTKMGGLYLVENSIKDTFIKAKKIGLSITAAPSGLVNDQTLKLATIKAILLADDLKCETITIIPGDFGTFNLQLTALHQLRAIAIALNEKPKHLKNIFIIMQDKLTERIFIDYLSQIYEGLDSNIN